MNTTIRARHWNCSTLPSEMIERHFIFIESVISKARVMMMPEEYQDFVEPYLSWEYLE